MNNLKLAKELVRLAKELAGAGVDAQWEIEAYVPRHEDTEIGKSGWEMYWDRITRAITGVHSVSGDIDFDMTADWDQDGLHLTMVLTSRMKIDRDRAMDEASDIWTTFSKIWLSGEQLRSLESDEFKVTKATRLTT